MNETLKKIVDGAELPAETKAVFREIFSALAERNGAVMEEIRARVFAEQEDSEKPWDIVTGIFSESELEKISGFNAVKSARRDFEIFGGSGELERNFFVDSDYGAFEKICGGDYRGRVGGAEFEYRIEPDAQFIAAERKIIRAAELYKIERPAIFSPWARRAVKIRILKPTEKLLAALGNSEVELADFLLSGQKLAWNLRISEAEDFERLPVESSVAPYGDGEIYRYVFRNVEASEYICPAAEDMSKVLGVSRDAARERLTIIASGNLSGDFDTIKILRLNNFGENFSGRLGRKIFANFDRARQIAKPARLRTERDIEQILFGLSLPESGYSCGLEGVSFEAAGEFLPRYQNDMDYAAQSLAAEQIYYSGRRNLPVCRLKFAGDEKFLVDYAAYVLRYLEDFYPEYRWAGAIS